MNTLAFDFLRAFALASFLSATIALAQPVRVMPVVPEGEPLGSGPHGFEIVNGVLYFDFEGGPASGGSALWKSDGTAAGTVLVKDVYSDLFTGPRASSGGRLYYYGGPFQNRGLWVSDGTLTGTQMLRATGTLRHILDVNGTVYFYDDDRLYATDGTPSGTRVVRQGAIGNMFNVGGVLFYFAAGGLWKLDGPSASPEFLRSFTFPGFGVAMQGGRFLFAGVEDINANSRLWVSDGTPAGTTQINVGAGPMNPAHMASIGPYVYFNASDGVGGRELWRSDGTPGGTVMIANIDSGPGDSIPFGFTAVGNMVVFSASTPALGRELWKTDGTVAGTVLLKDFGPFDSNPESFAMANGALCFVVGGIGTRRDLWRTDGTASGTTELMQDVDATFVYPDLVSTGTRVYVKKRTATSGFQLWSSDCNSPAGNVLITDFQLGVSNSVHTFNSLTGMDGYVLLRAETTANGLELWRGDTAGGTQLKDMEPGAGSGLEAIATPSGNLEPRPPSVRPWVRVGNTFYFRGVTSAHGAALWRSDGTAAGTVLVKDIAAGAQPSYSYHSYPDQLTDVGGTLFFVADDGIHGLELWKSDGTEAGTVLVKDIVPGPNPTYNGPVGLMSLNGTLYFWTGDGVNGFSLWKSDGTAAGTVPVTNIVPGAGPSNPNPLATLGGTLMFLAGYELWKSDGTAGGTELVRDLRAGRPSVNVNQVVVMNGVLYLNTFGGTGGAQLWRSDGTAAGTFAIFTLPAGGITPADFQLARLTAIGATLYFWTDPLSPSGSLLWKSDGTPAGTVPVRAFGRQSPAFDIGTFVAVGGIVYFLAVEDFGRSALWRTDGTLAGTYRVDLFSGFRGSNPTQLTAVGDRLYFIANDGLNPRSLYYYVPRPPSQEVTRLGNLASRMQVAQGEAVMIGGFAVAGQGPKRVAIVAYGPSLSAHGVASPMQDPTLRLVRQSDGMTIATNDTWGIATNAPQLVAAGFAPADPREAAILIDVEPGLYTAIVEGAAASTGVSVLGIYEVDQLGNPLVNIAARGMVQTGENVMIGGFVIQGPHPQTVAVVATGPSLAAHGIANPLPNPHLTLVRQSDQSIVATNDNWMEAPNAALIEGAGFAPPVPNEAAILITLPPGAYTAIVSGSGGSTGVGLVSINRVN